MIVMTSLAMNYYISPGIASGITTILLIILALILFYRWSYTVYYRNKRYWNKRDQPKFVPLPTPSCPSLDLQGGAQYLIKEGTQAAKQLANTATGALDFTTNLASVNMNALNIR